MLDHILTEISDCVFVFDLVIGRYQFISPDVQVVFGYSAQNFHENTNLYYNIIEDDCRENVRQLAQTLKEIDSCTLQYSITTSTGAQKKVSSKNILLTDPKLGHQILVSIIKEVTDAALSVDEPIQVFSDESFLFQRNPVPMWIYDSRSLAILRVNASACAIYGYTEQEFLLMTIRDIRPAIDIGKFDSYIAGKAFEQNRYGFNTAGVWKHTNKRGDIMYAEITGDDIMYKGSACRIIAAADVTEKTHYREEFNKREQFLNSLIDSQTNFLIRVDTAGLFTFVNKQYLKTLGFKKNEVIGQHFSVSTAPEDLTKCENAFHNCLNHPGKVIRLRHKKLDKAGNAHDTEWELIAITNEEGEISEIQGVGQNITHKLKIESEIKTAAKKLDTFIESINDYFFILNDEWKFIRVNTAFEKATGRARHQLLGELIWDVFPVIIGTAFEEAYRMAADKKISIQFVEHVKIADRWFNTSVYPSEEGLTVFIKDITREKRAQEEISWTKNNLEALINNTEDQIWSVDKDLRYVYMNRPYQTRIAHLTGVQPNEGDYSYLHAGYTPEIIEIWNGYYQRALEGERYSITNETTDPDTGELLCFEVSFNPIYKKRGEITGVGCFARNITEWLKIEQALMDQNDRLRNIASLSSHELRRPVASMIGLINLMDREDFFNPDNREIIEHVLTVGKEIDEVIRLIVDQTFMDEMPYKLTDPKTRFDI